MGEEGEELEHTALQRLLLERNQTLLDFTHEREQSGSKELKVVIVALLSERDASEGGEDLLESGVEGKVKEWLGGMVNGLGEEMGMDVLEVEGEGEVSWLGFHLLMNKELIVN